MSAYFDTSVILRLVLGEPGKMADWRKYDPRIASDLAEVECLRTVDRLRIRHGLSLAEIVRECNPPALCRHPMADSGGIEPGIQAQSLLDRAKQTAPLCARNSCGVDQYPDGGYIESGLIRAVSSVGRAPDF